MNLIRRKLLVLIGGITMALGTINLAVAGMPAPLDNAGNVKIALVRYLSTGDWTNLYYGEYEEKPMKWKTIAPAYK